MGGACVYPVKSCVYGVRAACVPLGLIGFLNLFELGRQTKVDSALLEDCAYKQTSVSK